MDRCSGSAWRLARRVKSEPIGFGFWANGFTSAAEINRPRFLVERIIQQSSIADHQLLSLSDSLLLLALMTVSAICAVAGWGLEGRLRHFLHGDRDGSRAQALIPAKRYSFSSASVRLSASLLLLAVWIFSTTCALAGWGRKAAFGTFYTATETDRAPRPNPAKRYSFATASS